MTETRFLARFATIANAAFNSMSANSTAVTAMSIGGHTINSTSMSAATNTFTVGTAAYFVANGDFYIGSNSAQGSAGLQVFGAGTRASIGFIQTSTATSGGSISGIDSRGFDGSNYFAGGTINFRAAENWSNTNHGTDIQFRTTPTGNGGALAESMRITANGNVGIGTSTPLARLDVVSSDRKRIRAAGASEEGIVLFQNGTTGTGTTNGFLVGIGGDSNAYLLNYHNSPMLFSTNGGERIRIAAGGNVGINNSNPLARLQVTTGASDGTDGVLINGGATNKSIMIRPSMGAGNSNGLVQAGDGGIIFDGGNFNTGAFVLAPWNTETACGLRMDSSGRVVMPNQPFAHIEGFAGNFEVTGVTGVLTGGSGLYFTGSMYNSVNGRFTVPVAGNYLIAFAGITQSTDTADTQVLIEVNGTQRGRAYSGGYSGGSLQWRALSFTGVYKLNANDYITFNKNVGTLHGNFFPFRTVYLLG